MASESKYRKEKNNPHSHHGHALKAKGKLKRRYYFNSSQRKVIKKFEIECNRQCDFSRNLE